MQNNLTTMSETIVQFQEYIKKNRFSKIVILADEKIIKLYKNYFDFISSQQKLFIPIKISEKEKDLTTCAKLWSLLAENSVDKNALWVNFGGVTVSELGGFVAATYKRGLRMVNIPTTLLAMIDASVGGKNGINIDGVKNLVGTFYRPDNIFLQYSFLATLSQRELLSGFGELIKYALIYNQKLWKEIGKLNSIIDYRSIKKEWIEQAIAIKNKIVEQDFFDQKERRILNFGHTFGHAIESLYLNYADPLSHGHAVALGIIYELYFSYSLNKLSKVEFVSILSYIRTFYHIPNFSEKEKVTMENFIFHDKKRKNIGIEVPLLEKIGKAIPIYEMKEEEVRRVLNVNFNNF